MAGRAGDEQVEVVDEAGRVVGVVSRAEMRRRNLRHRSVAVVVFSPAGDAVLAHRRADWKDVWPGYWDVCFGGVLEVGEDWADGAVRELVEEAGVVVAHDDLVDLGELAFADDMVTHIGRAFSVRHSGPFTFPDGEVEELAWVPLADLPAWLDGRQVCPDTLVTVVSLLVTR